MKRIQDILYEHLEADQADARLSGVNKFLMSFILFSSLVAVLETEVTIRKLAPGVFDQIELFVVTVFIAEYVSRLVAVGKIPRYSGIKGRLKYVFSIWAIIDLVAIIPFFLTGLTDNTFILRLLRIFRILRLSKLGRYSAALIAITSAVRHKRHELTMSAIVAVSVMLLSSSLLYIFEGAAQPEAFGSILRSFWWSIATLTTVGYGDVTPITAAGRFFAGLTAIAGIGLIAMPTGILAAAFSEALHKNQ